ncbi:MAG: (Fe-S)-binding protein [Ilumatobacteraceae bacterium]
MDLGIDGDELNTCVQCGLCLSACPTFRVTGDETMSPRGRIALMREVQLRDAPLTEEVIEAFETCVQCRGCEPACPSDVPYGRLMERTREALVAQGVTSRWQRLAMRPLGHPRLLRASSVALAVAQRLHLVPNRLGLTTPIPLRQPKPRPPERPPTEPATAAAVQSTFASDFSDDRPSQILTQTRFEGARVYLFTGCVMDAWQREIHLAGQRVLEAAGFEVALTGPLAPCCGALHAHAGFTDDTRAYAERMIERLEPDIPVIVDSAGCGAAMKDYGHLLGTPEGVAFAGRVHDIQEWLATSLDRLPTVAPLDLRVAIQDPCHLRHVQRVHLATRTVLAPFVRELVELDDDGLCCGAGGAYSVFQPELADQIRARKLGSIERAAPDVVASANPGCSMHLAARGVKTVHPMQLVDRALRPLLA